MSEANEIISAAGTRTPGNQSIFSIPGIVISPLSSPVRKAVGLKKLEHQDAWLPITESRNGNKYFAVFHILCSGIGIQALYLPVAFTTLGWIWGIISLIIAFMWQLYTIWLLVQLHESFDPRIRYSRYLQLFTAGFDSKVGKLFVWSSVMFLSSGTCIAFITVGGLTLKQFIHLTCGVNSLTSVECYLVFTCGAVLLSLLPNLNSIAGVSLIGAVTAIGFCSLIWVVSVAKPPLAQVSYEPVKATTQIGQFFSVLNALGTIAFAFRGHNLILEIQATMPSNDKHTSLLPMWKGVKTSYTIIAFCLFPLAIGGYWAYGNKITSNEEPITAFYKLHSHDGSRFVLALINVFIIINALTSFQIYAMPTFDDLESKYTSRKDKPCPWWLRTFFRLLFGFGCFFTAVAMPLSENLVALIGGITLPVTLAYPWFMWLKIRKPTMYRTMWWLNWGLGLFGLGLSGLLVAAGTYLLVNNGVQARFFKPW